MKLTKTNAMPSALVLAAVEEQELALNPGQKVGGYRWRICALLFFATTINYVDRQVLGILAPQLQEDLGWTEIEYGYIVTTFQFAYAIGFLLMGNIMDKFGTRKGFSFAIVLWSLAAMLHAVARSAFGFGAARFGLGLGEAGNFPAAIKTVSEWFPKKERSLAIGIFNSGANVGAILAPLSVPFIALQWGWEWAFILTGALGFIWLIFWLKTYKRPEEHPTLTKDELAYIQSGVPEKEKKVPWLKLFPHRQTWAFAVAKFITDPVWWFYLYWLPKYLNTSHGLTLDKIGLPLIVIYVFSDLGSIGGGWLSSFLMRKGWSVNLARKTTMFVCALAVTPIFFASQTSDLWIAVGLISLATAAHQGWSANLFTLVSDMFPKQAVGSVVGIGGMAGAIGGMIVATAAGYLLSATGSYMLLFIIASVSYLLALLIIQLLAPKLAPLKA
ncbi:MFS transporter [Nafulsella turpanensis]|uniref:MFS transporter n=1 Tax=Nafulsella turpanensis TaxID=1265690 RepID=UPI0009DA7D32|nr:MFS transporter [Nafulsella turpanensis]